MERAHREQLESLVLEAVTDAGAQKAAHISEDVGACPDGLVYTAAEHITGQPIDDYCDNQRLDVRSRLMLFAQVCEAVHVAHQHAMIHGNLKPRNILVTDRGVPMVIGYGRARTLRLDPGSDETAINAIRDHPEYASPEQIMGEMFTTASDVYALGVILYQILSGHWPYQLTTRSISEILQAICEQLPQKPSAAIARDLGLQETPRIDPSPAVDLTTTLRSTSESTLHGAWPASPTPGEIAAARGLPPGRLKQLLNGELDAIVLMAIYKKPEQRYSSARHLGDDLRRYLQGMPVQALPDSWIYRARKFCQRYPAAIAVGVLSLLVLTAGIIGTSTTAIMARRDRNHARESLDKAQRAVNQIFTRLAADSLLDEPQMHPLRESLLVEVRHFYEDLLKQYGTDRSLRVESALAHAHLARIVSLTGSSTEAAAHYRDAVARWDKLIAEQPDNQDYQANLIRTLNELTAVLIPLDGFLQEAASTNDRARELLKQVRPDNPPSASDRHELSQTFRNSAEIHKAAGQSEDAIKDMETVVEIKAQLLAELSQSLTFAISLANAHSDLGQVRARQAGDLLESLESYSHAIRIRETIVQEHPDLVDQSYRLASELSALSILQQKLKRPDSAFQNLSRSLEISECISQTYPNVIEYNEILGASYNTMSDLLHQRGESAEALVFARKANAVFDHLVAKDSQDKSSPLGLAQSYNLIGRLLKENGQMVAALQSFRRAVDLYESLPQIDPQNSFKLACNLALCIPLIGRIDGSPSSNGSPQELSKTDGRRRKVYADRAIEALQSSADGGFLDIEMLEANPDFNALRSRTDFRSLMKHVEEKRVSTSS